MTVMKSMSTKLEELLKYVTENTWPIETTVLIRVLSSISGLTEYRFLNTLSKALSSVSCGLSKFF